MPIVALTATATEEVRVDVIKKLGMHMPLFFQCSFNRPNLIYQVRQKDSETVKEIVKFVREIYPNKAGIIYCCTVKDCEDVANKLGMSLKCGVYHA